MTQESPYAIGASRRDGSSIEQPTFVFLVVVQIVAGILHRAQHRIRRVSPPVDPIIGVGQMEATAAFGIPVGVAHQVRIPADRCWDDWVLDGWRLHRLSPTTTGFLKHFIGSFRRRSTLKRSSS